MHTNNSELRLQGTRRFLQKTIEQHVNKVAINTKTVRSNVVFLNWLTVFFFHQKCSIPLKLILVAPFDYSQKESFNLVQKFQNRISYSSKDNSFGVTTVEQRGRRKILYRSIMRLIQILNYLLWLCCFFLFAFFT